MSQQSSHGLGVYHETSFTNAQPNGWNTLTSSASLSLVSTVIRRPLQRDHPPSVPIVIASLPELRFSTYPRTFPRYTPYLTPIVLKISPTRSSSLHPSLTALARSNLTTHQPTQFSVQNWKPGSMLTRWTLHGFPASNEMSHIDGRPSQCFRTFPPDRRYTDLTFRV